MKKRSLFNLAVCIGIMSNLCAGNMNVKAIEPIEDYDIQNVVCEDVFNCITDIEDSSIIEFTDNKIIYDEDEMSDVIKEIDISAINKMCKENNMDTYTEESLVETFIQGIEITNEQLKDEELTMLNDGSLIESDDDSFYLQGGSTYDVTHWWGKSRYKSTADANAWVRDLNRGAAACGGIGVIGTLTGIAAPIAGGIGCWILWDMAANVDYYNSLSSRGIKADIPWSIVGYSVSTQ